MTCNSWKHTSISSRSALYFIFSSKSSSVTAHHATRQNIKHHARENHHQTTRTTFGVEGLAFGNVRNLSIQISSYQQRTNLLLDKYRWTDAGWHQIKSFLQEWIRILSISQELHTLVAKVILSLTQRTNLILNDFRTPCF